MSLFDEQEILVDSTQSLDTESEDAAEKRITHIYDDSKKFLDYVSSRLRFDMSKGRELIFVSQNISLETFIKHFFGTDNQDLVLYDVNYFYESMPSFLSMFARSYSESLTRFCGKYKCDPAASTVILDFGSFFQSSFGFEDYLGFVEDLPVVPLLITALDASLLSPAELGLALSYCPNIAINNNFMRPPVHQRFTGLISTHLATNSALLTYTESLARAERNDVLNSIESQMRLQEIISRDNFDKELGDRAWQVADRDAEYHSSNRDLKNAAELDLTSPRLNRRIMSRKSIINFRAAATEPEEKDIEIRLE